MKIAVDIDDVLTDSGEGLAVWLKERGARWDRQPNSPVFLPDGRQITVTEAFDRAYAQASVVLGLSPIPGAKIAIRMLSGDHTIVLVTHRPEFTRASTEAWVAKNIGEFPIFHVPRDDPKTSVEYDLLIDDAISTTEAAVAAGRVAILFAGYQNAGRAVMASPRLFRALSWLDVLDIVGALDRLAGYNGGRV